MPNKNPGLHRVTYDCMKNGVEFVIVTFGGVITESSVIAKRCIGHDLEWLKRELRKGETYSAKEVEKTVPLWLQNKEFEGSWDMLDKHEGKVVVDIDIEHINNTFGLSGLVTIREQTKLPEIKGVKFL